MLERIGRGDTLVVVYIDRRSRSIPHLLEAIKRQVLDAGIRSELPVKVRLALVSVHSLGPGLASSAEVVERYIQNDLGYSSIEMTRRYQCRSDWFRVNLTQTAGLSTAVFT